VLLGRVARTQGVTRWSAPLPRVPRAVNPPATVVRGARGSARGKVRNDRRFLPSLPDAVALVKREASIIQAGEEVQDLGDPGWADLVGLCRRFGVAPDADARQVRCTLSRQAVMERRGGGGGRLPGGGQVGEYTLYAEDLQEVPGEFV